MVDHDRDAGSRGGEPRDPSRRSYGEQPRTETLAPGPPHPTPYGGAGAPYGGQPYAGAGTRYGGQPYAGAGPDAHAGPGWGPLPPPRPKPAFLDFLRRKRTQVVGAGLAGLVLGAVIGGGAVALTGALTERPGPSAPWDPRYFQDRPGWTLPDERGPYCYEAEGRVICDVNPAPLPTRTG